MNIADDSVFPNPAPRKPEFLEPFFHQFTAVWWIGLVVGLILLIGVAVLAWRGYLSTASELFKFWVVLGGLILAVGGAFGLYMSY